jgi:hypothetical protein
LRYPPLTVRDDVESRLADSAIQLGGVRDQPLGATPDCESTSRHRSRFRFAIRESNGDRTYGGADVEARVRRYRAMPGTLWWLVGIGVFVVTAPGRSLLTLVDVGYLAGCASAFAIALALMWYGLSGIEHTKARLLSVSSDARVRATSSGAMCSSNAPAAFERRSHRKCEERKS